MQKTKTVLLKQVSDGFSLIGKTVCGILRIERDCETTISLSVINATMLDNGEFWLFLVDYNKSLFSFPLGKRPTNFTKTIDCASDFSKGVCALLVAQTDLVPVTVALGKTEDFPLSSNDCKKTVAEKFLTDLKRKPNSTPEYDDEAVATENYFELDQSLSFKLEKIKELENAELRLEDERSACPNQEKEEKKHDGTCVFQNETDTCKRQNRERECFHQTVQAELNALFARFPQYDGLKGYFPDSRWVKIPYSTKDYYIVGEIKEDGDYKYICYGVPAVYSPEPPKELKGYCSFIPLSLFDLHGQGFWMMFQSAQTGECIHGK